MKRWIKLGVFILPLMLTGYAEGGSRSTTDAYAGSMKMVLETVSDCVEMSDDCGVCRKHNNEWACSTPGIACLSNDWRCLDRQSDTASEIFSRGAK